MVNKYTVTQRKGRAPTPIPWSYHTITWQCKARAGGSRVGRGVGWSRGRGSPTTRIRTWFHALVLKIKCLPVIEEPCRAHSLLFTSGQNIFPVTDGVPACVKKNCSYARGISDPKHQTLFVKENQDSLFCPEKFSTNAKGLSKFQFSGLSKTVVFLVPTRGLSQKMRLPVCSNRNAQLTNKQMLHWPPSLTTICCKCTMPRMRCRSWSVRPLCSMSSWVSG